MNVETLVIEYETVDAYSVNEMAYGCYTNCYHNTDCGSDCD